MARSTTAQKRKTFPALVAPIPKQATTNSDIHSDEDTSDDESDAPEAETLSGGRAAADARAVVIAQHKQKLQEKRKEKNKAREAFIQSTKSKALVIAPADQNADGNDGSVEVDSEPEDEEGPNDPVLEARMARAMRNAEEESEEEGDEKGEGKASSDGQDDSPMPQAPTLSTRLPDSIFAAAAAAHQLTERKRARKSLSKEVRAKRRRTGDAPVEQVINGRTLRATTPLNAPPAVSSSSSRKMKRSTKGGSVFRRKWNKLDALRAQIRSRSGPARNFATTVQ